MVVRRIAAVAVGVTLMAGLAAPAEAVQPAKWNPVSPTTLESVVNSINAEAKAAKKPKRSPGCFQGLVWSGKSNYVVMNIRAGKNVEACGDPVRFGIRAYRKSGSKWVFVGGPAGGAGSACEYQKAATSADKSFIKSTKMCR